MVLCLHSEAVLIILSVIIAIVSCNSDYRGGRYRQTGILAAAFLVAASLFAQTNNFSAANSPSSPVERSEKIRAECLDGRRMICGKILRVLPEGIVVESGYTDLLRPPLSGSWLVPAAARV